MKQPAIAHIPPHAFLSIAYHFKMGTEFGHKAEYHGQYQGKRRNDPSEQIHKFIRCHHLVITGEPQDGYKQHGGQHNTIYNGLQCHRPCFQVKKRGNSIVVKCRIDKCHNDHCRQHKSQVEFHQRFPSFQAQRIQGSAEKRNAQQYRMAEKHGDKKHRDKIKEIHCRMTGGERIRPFIHNTDPPHHVPGRRCSAILSHHCHLPHTGNSRSWDTSRLHCTSSLTVHRSQIHRAG